MATATFNHTGGVQNWVVPAGVYLLDIECWGAEGGTGYDPGSGNLAGGNGGYARGTLIVTPGETLRVHVGGTGTDRILNSAPGDGGGGYNGGGAARNANNDVNSSPPAARGGGGGGASDVRQGGTALSNRKIVAGGGGGGGAITHDSSGFGLVGSAGADGGASTGEDGSWGSTGGTQSAGGSAGDSTDPTYGGIDRQHTATGGSSGNGGAGAAGGNAGSIPHSVTFSGGGGGGGYYGGGGGGIAVWGGMMGVEGYVAGAGSGGSNFVGGDGLTSISNQRGVKTGHGQVVFTYETEPPNTPTSVGPSGGQQVDTDVVGMNAVVPTLSATISTHPGKSGVLQRVEWQLATDAGFTENVHTVTEPTGDQRTSGATTEIGQPLTRAGSWFVRARVIDQYGLASGWSAASTFEAVLPHRSWGLFL